MRLGIKDATATLFTALAVLVFLADYQNWDVALVGDSHRWAAAGVAFLGILTCALGDQEAKMTSSPRRWGIGIWTLTGLGAAALVLAVLAIATGSFVLLVLLTANNVLLWLGSTLRHIASPSASKPLAT